MYVLKCFAVLILLLAVIAFVPGCADEPPAQPAPASAVPEKPAPEELPATAGAPPAAKEQQSEMPTIKKEEVEEFDIIVELKPGGAIHIDEKEIKPERLVRSLLQKVADKPTELVNGRRVSTVRVLVKGQSDTCCGAVGEVINACAYLGVRRMYYAHPDVNQGKVVKLWLPIFGAQPRAITLQELRIKLVWVDPQDLGKKLHSRDDPDATRGIMAFRIRGRWYMKGKRPDWEGVQEKIESSLKDFRPTKSYKKLPVIIDAMANIRFADLLTCILLCRQYDVGQISLACFD